MSSVIGFIILIAIVLFVAAFGMWAAQAIAARMGKKAPVEFESRAAAPLSGDEPVTHHLSPDSRFDLITVANEMKMSHWVENPSLIEARSNRELFALDFHWSADSVAWSPDGRSVTLSLRKYPGDVPGLNMTADLLSGEVRFDTRAGAETARIEEINAWLAGYVRRFGV